MSAFIRVTAAVIIQDGNVLITQRHAHDARGGVWEFPGGKIEPGETPEACLRRELQEELTIDADVHDLLTVTRHTYPECEIKLLAYWASIRSGAIELRAHQDYRWVPVNSLRTYHFSDANRPIVTHLITKAKRERFLSSP